MSTMSNIDLQMRNAETLRFTVFAPNATLEEEIEDADYAWQYACKLSALGATFTVEDQNGNRII